MSSGRTLQVLLRKEWQHNRGFFLVTGLLLMYVPTLKSLYYILAKPSQVVSWGGQLDYMLGFYQQLHPHFASIGDMHSLAILGVILLGALLLGEERRGGLTYLVTTPVRRRDIILAKFIAGMVTIILAMLANLLLVLVFSRQLGLEIGTAGLLRWILVAALTLLCLFTLVLLVSTFTAGVLQAGALGYFLIFLPGVMVAMLEHVAARYFSAAETFSIKLNYLASYLTITDYLNGDHWMRILGVDYHAGWRMSGYTGTNGPAPNLALESLILLLAIGLLLFLAVIIFERVSLEEQGRLFASHQARRFFIILAGLVAGYLFLFPPSSSLAIFLVALLATTAGFYFLLEWLPHRRRDKGMVRDH